MEPIEILKSIIRNLVDRLIVLKNENKVTLEQKYTMPLLENIQNFKDIKLDKNLSDIYSLKSNGFLINWIADDENDIRGRLNFAKLEHVIADQRDIIYFDGDEGKSICNYHPFDHITEEANCGIYIDQETRQQSQAIYYHYRGTSAISNLDIDFKGYIEMACEAKIFFYWPKVLLDIQSNSESPETKRFKEEMPKLFPDFNWGAFVEKYESLRLSKK